MLKVPDVFTVTAFLYEFAATSASYVIDFISTTIMSFLNIHLQRIWRCNLKAISEYEH